MPYSFRIVCGFFHVPQNCEHPRVVRRDREKANKLTVTRKKAKILTVNRKIHYPTDTLIHFWLLKFLEIKEFNETIIPFALVGYETGYSQLGATRLVGYLLSHIQHALME